MISPFFQRAAALVALPLAACASLPGCKSSYEVDVRNLTDQPVTVTLQRSWDRGSMAMRQERIAPADRAGLGPVEVDRGTRVWVQVDFEGNVGYPGVLDLSRGLTVVNVRRVDEGSQGRIRLEEVPRP